MDDLDALIAKLTDEGVEVETRAEWDSEVGRFAGYTTWKAIPWNCGSPPEPEDVCAPQCSDRG